MNRKRQIKIGIFFALITAFFLIREFTPVGAHMTIENLRAFIEPMGAWGAVLFIAAFTIGTIVQIPGFIFYTAAIMIFDTFLGGILAYVGSVLAVTASFYFARHMGGNMLDSVKHPRIRKILDRLEKQPVLTVGILRAVLWVSPPINYALAFSAIPDRKYLMGSVIGLAAPALFFVFGASCIFI